MNAITCTVRDSATMLRRQLRHMLRYPSLTVLVVAMPVVFLLLFVFVLGGTMGSGLGPSGAVGAAGAGGGRSAYLEYVVPGMLGLGKAQARMSDFVRPDARQQIAQRTCGHF